MTSSATSPVVKDVTIARTSFDSPVISLSSATSRNFLYVHTIVSLLLLVGCFTPSKPKGKPFNPDGGKKPPGP